MSNIAQVYPAGKELATGGNTAAVVAVAGHEPAAVLPAGKELAKGGQDLAK